MLDYLAPPDPPTCKVCGCALEWEDCDAAGCEDGFVDCYEEDPINFVEGEEFEPCSECHGKGGYLACPNVEDHERIRREQGTRAGRRVGE